MKKSLLIILLLLSSYCGMAQHKLAFPFQGGKDIMTRFFADSIKVSPAIMQQKASGLVLFKFTADQKGKITKIIIYYADDAVLVEPVIEALKKSNHKWIVPDYAKTTDFILPVAYRFNMPTDDDAELHKAVYDFNRNKKTIFSADQVPLNEATLLPTITVNYNVNQ